MSSSSAGFGSVSAFSFHCDLPWCHERFPVYLQISFLSPPTPTTFPTWAKEKSLLPVLTTARSCWRRMWVQQSTCGVASQSDRLQPGRHSWPQDHQPPGSAACSGHRASLVLHVLNAGKEARRQGETPPLPITVHMPLNSTLCFSRLPQLVCCLCRTLWTSWASAQMRRWGCTSWRGPSCITGTWSSSRSSGRSRQSRTAQKVTLTAEFARELHQETS